MWCLIVASFSRKRNTQINLAFKYIQLAVSVVSGIALMPIYLRYLTIEQYGAWLTIGSVVIWLAAFDPGIGNLLIQRVSKACGMADSEAVRDYVFAGVAFAAFAGLLVAGTGYLLSTSVIDWIGLQTQPKELMTSMFQVAALTSGMMVFGYSMTGSALGLQQSLEVGLLFLGSVVFKIVLVLVLLQHEIGPMALPLADLASASLVVLASVLVVWRGLKRYPGTGWKVSLIRLKEFGGLFIYSFGARFGKVISRNLDNFFIARTLGPEAVAIYSITATVPRQAENLVNQPVAAFRPALAHLAGSGDTVALRCQLSRLLNYVFWSLGVLVAGLIAFNDDFVILWVGASRFAGVEVGLGLCLVFFLHVWSNALGTLGFSSRPCKTL